MASLRQHLAGGYAAGRAPIARAVVSAALMATLGWPAIGQQGAPVVTPTLEVRALECVPYQDNGRVDASLEPAELPEGWEARTYFRRSDYGNFYYVPMSLYPEDERPEDLYTHWGVLPVPEEDNEVTELYVAIADQNRVVVAQTEPVQVPVTDDCDVDLNDPQSDFANALIIGETSRDQEYRRVVWWECEGLNDRIDVYGEVRDDDSCLVAAYWWGSALVPAAVGVGITTILVLDDEPAPPPGDPPPDPPPPPPDPPASPSSP